LVGALAVLAILVIGAALWSWYRPEKVITKTEYVKVPQIKEVKTIERVNVPGPKEVITIEKEKVVEKLKLPEELAQDKSKQVIATGEIPPYDGTTDVVAIMDIDDGKGELIAKQKPLPLVSFRADMELGVRGGYASVSAKDKGPGVQGSVYGRWTFLRVGKVFFGLYGEANTIPDAKAQVDVGFRW
jgi:hypothetical protein